MGFPFMPLIIQLFCCETVGLLEGLAALHPEQLNTASVGTSGLPLLNIPCFDNAPRRWSDFYLDDNLLPTGQPCHFTKKHIMCKLVYQDIVFLHQLITYFMVSSYLKQYMANNVILSHFLITLEIAEGFNKWLQCIVIAWRWKSSGPSSSNLWLRVFCGKQNCGAVTGCMSLWWRRYSISYGWEANPTPSVEGG